MAVLVLLSPALLSSADHSLPVLWLLHLIPYHRSATTMLSLVGWVALPVCHCPDSTFPQSLRLEITCYVGSPDIHKNYLLQHNSNRVGQIQITLVVLCEFLALFSLLSFPGVYHDCL